MSAVEVELIDRPDLPLLVALSHLSVNEREAFIDNHLLGHTLESIANRVGISRQAVSQHAYRARMKLARLLFPDHAGPIHGIGGGSYYFFRAGCRCEECRQVANAKSATDWVRAKQRFSNGTARSDLDGGSAGRAEGRNGSDANG